MARTAIILFSSLLLLAACSAPPTWLSVDISPAPGTEGVDVGTTVQATFADSLESLEADDFQLMHGDQPVDVTLDLSDDGTTATLHVAGEGLAEMTQYRVLLREGISSVNGYSLAATLEATFVTGKAKNDNGAEADPDGASREDGDSGETENEDGETGNDEGETEETDPEDEEEGTGETGETGGDEEGEQDDDDGTAEEGPNVIDHGPLDGEVGVSPSIFAVFNEDVTVESEDIIVSIAGVEDGGIAGEVTYDSDSNTAYFAPTDQLLFDTTYDVQIVDAVNGDGEAMSGPFGWSFTTTADEYEPVRVDGGITFEDGVISIPFTHPLDPSSLNGDSFKVVNNSAQWEMDYDSETYSVTFTAIDDINGDDFSVKISHDGNYVLAANGARIPKENIDFAID